jgi:hypothetical protein
MRIDVMAAWRHAIELAISEEDLTALGAIARSQTEPASRVARARMLLAYRKDLSFLAVARTVGVHHQTVRRCVERALVHGPMAALDDMPRPRKEPTRAKSHKARYCLEHRDQPYGIQPDPRPWFADQSVGRFEFTLTPKPGS